MVVTTDSPRTAPEGAGALGIRHHFTRPGEDPYDTVTWELRETKIINHLDGSVVFAQSDVEFPQSWSATAGNIVAQKYFRGTLGTPEREHSLRQVIDRVVDTITKWGTADGYFAADEAVIFAAELRWLLVHQRVAFNSPVWFNIGVTDVPQQASACFILAVEDRMDSILNWYVEEGRIFKGGSGAGVNLSAIRGSREKLTGGGEASGPVSFMRGADASAGTIRSGGKTRRAAKMVLLDIDHPDVEAFIWCKAREERKARALAAAGFDMSLDGEDAFSVQYQNANNSVRLTDEFMASVEAGDTWDLKARTTGLPLRTLPARDLFSQIAAAAWECADPGVHFSSTINSWHTAPATGPITASNPCSEYLHLDNSACNLASINLLPFAGGGEAGGEAAVSATAASATAGAAFDVAGLESAVRTTFLAQDILVGRADYPTEKIGETSRRFRQLGLGYTNLGALLMSFGVPYDSPQGRALAAAATAALCGQAYATSADMAARLGAFDGFAQNADHMEAVLRRHQSAVADLGDETGVATDPATAATTSACDSATALLQAAAQRSWQHAVEGCASHGVRNSQATVIAPTGTISFMMDCDTTGIEPDLGLVKHKKLVGGGDLTIVNQTLRPALRRLGYDEKQASEIEAHVLEHGTISTAPGLAAEHLPVFACAMGDNVIGPEGHVQMMAACQPFISGAISKTVNLPEATTIADIEDLLMLAWRRGLKSVAIYRDNCKVAQPLSTGSGTGADGSAAESGDGGKADGSAEDSEAMVTAVAVIKDRVASVSVGGFVPTRQRMPRTRNSRTLSFRVADCHGYMTVGEYEDGQPGEIFLTVAKQGSTLAGIMDALAISVSHGLQYGVPLRSYVEAFVNVRFEPAGITDDPQIRIATSLVDYIFRRLAMEYLPFDQRRDLGVLSVDERIEPNLPGLEPALVETAIAAEVALDPLAVDQSGLAQNGMANDYEPASVQQALPVGAIAKTVRSDAPLCMSCGDQMLRAGSCFACPSCGTTSGCG